MSKRTVIWHVVIFTVSLVVGVGLPVMGLVASWVAPFAGGLAGFGLVYVASRAYVARAERRDLTLADAARAQILSTEERIKERQSAQCDLASDVMIILSSSINTGRHYDHEGIIGRDAFQRLAEHAELLELATEEHDRAEVVKMLEFACDLAAQSIWSLFGRDDDRAREAIQNIALSLKVARG